MLAPLLGVLAVWAAAATAAPPAATAATQATPSAVIAVLPYGTTVEQIAAVPELAPGIVSAGLGTVPVAQTNLDISQGNRLNEDLYDEPLPRLYVEDGRVPPGRWKRVTERAEAAPARIVPGLLASTLEDAGVPAVVEADSGLVLADRRQPRGRGEDHRGAGLRGRLRPRPDREPAAAR